MKHALPTTLCLAALAWGSSAVAQAPQSMPAQLERVKNKVVKIQREGNLPKLTFSICAGAALDAAVEGALGAEVLFGALGTLGLKEFGNGAAVEADASGLQGLIGAVGGKIEVTDEICFNVPVLVIGGGSSAASLVEDPTMSMVTDLVGEQSLADGLESLIVEMKAQGEALGALFPDAVRTLGLGPSALTPALDTVEAAVGLVEDPLQLLDPNTIRDAVVSVPLMGEGAEAIESAVVDLITDPCSLPASMPGEVGDLAADVCSGDLPLRDELESMQENIERITDIDYVTDQVIDPAARRAKSVADELSSLINSIKTVADQIDAVLP